MLLRRTLCAPILFETTYSFLESIHCFEGIQILSRKYPFSADLIERLLRLTNDHNHSSTNFTLMTLANQFLLYGNDWLEHDIARIIKASPAVSLSHLRRQLAIDADNQFAINYLLYIFFRH